MGHYNTDVLVSKMKVKKNKSTIWDLFVFLKHCEDKAISSAELYYELYINLPLNNFTY